MLETPVALVDLGLLALLTALASCAVAIVSIRKFTAAVRGLAQKNDRALRVIWRRLHTTLGTMEDFDKSTLEFLDYSRLSTEATRSRIIRKDIPSEVVEDILRSPDPIGPYKHAMKLARARRVIGEIRRLHNAVVLSRAFLHPALYDLLTSIDVAALQTLREIEIATLAKDWPAVSVLTNNLLARIGPLTDSVEQWIRDQLFGTQ